jgi:membrane protease YdiL (CAAX protease family)
MSARSLWSCMSIGFAAAAATVLVAPAPAPTSPRVGSAAAVLLGVPVGVLVFVALARVPPRLPRRGELTRAQLAFLLGWAWVEEVIWRRLLLATLAVAAGVAVGLATATALFALAHRQGRAAHLLTGAAFGGAFVVTGRLGAAVASHAVYNLLVAGSRPPQGGT